MRALFILILFFHGAIHILGFVKAFDLAPVSQLSKAISRPAGIFWLLGALLLTLAGLILLLDVGQWWLFALPGFLVSQVLIIFSWHDAKFGTIANAIILVPLTITMMNALPGSFGNIYKVEVQNRLARFSPGGLISEADIQALPVPVSQYLRNSGVVGRPAVRNFRAVFTGQIRPSPNSDWLDFTSEQYNFVDDPARIFFIQSTLFGIPFEGLHLYKDTNATMQIRVASLFQTVDARGPKMTRGETVTLFNDMCILAPATLIENNIQWETIDSHTVRAIFTNRGQTISARLHFNPAGDLVNFESHDRYLTSDGTGYTNYPWWTPITDYKDFDGSRIATKGEALWKTPDGDYIYGRFNLIEIQYNCERF